MIGKDFAVLFLIIAMLCIGIVETKAADNSPPIVTEKAVNTVNYNYEKDITAVRWTPEVAVKKNCSNVSGAH